MADIGSLSQTEIIAATTNTLCKNGFSEVNGLSLAGVDRSRHRLFEDAYSIVAVIVYSTWKELIDTWMEGQASLVEIMSQKLTHDEYKAWEGYLILLTASLVPTGEEPQIEKIRYDTARVRKLVSTGSQLKEVSDVEDALLPVLPLAIIPDFAADAVLARLPELLQDDVLWPDAVRTVIDAFHRHEPLVESLHRFTGGK